MRHREQTQAQRQRLESMLQKHGANPRAHIDQAMQALVNETKKMMDMVKGNDLRDAALIASAQKVEHYEIAAYGTAAALAGQLDLRDDQRLLHQSLEEEREADAVLTSLAKGEVNRDALAA
jgi:ferritin-like metal-binding protein YciE